MVPWPPYPAREKVLELLAAGLDPLDEREGSKGQSVAAVVEKWLKRDQDKNWSVSEVERIMNHDVLPAWSERPIDEIRKRDVITLIDNIADRDAPIMANQVLVHIKRLLKWTAGRNIIESDPAAHVKKVAVETKRERVLTDEELAAVWRAAQRAPRKRYW